MSHSASLLIARLRVRVVSPKLIGHLSGSTTVHTVMLVEPFSLASTFNTTPIIPYNYHTTVLKYNLHSQNW